MNLRRIAKGVAGRTYEGLLYLGLVPYRRPFQHFSVEVWNEGYSIGRHDDFEYLEQRARFGVLVAYLGAIDGPLDILDVGCATGVLRSRVPDEKVRTYLGVDTSDVAIRKAQARGQARTEYRISSIPEEGSFDVVICNEVLMLIEDWDEALTKARRLMRPDGLFLVSNTRYHGDFVLRRKLRDYFDLIDETVVIQRGGFHKHRLGAYRIKQPAAATA